MCVVWRGECRCFGWLGCGVLCGVVALLCLSHTNDPPENIEKHERHEENVLRSRVSVHTSERFLGSWQGLW